MRVQARSHAADRARGARESDDAHKAHELARLGSEAHALLER